MGKLWHKKKFTVNQGLVHLVVEIAAAEAMKTEVERQFREQFPDKTLVLLGNTVNVPDITDISLNVPGFNIEWINP